MERQRRQRAKREIVSLCHQGLDSATLFHETARHLATVVPFDRSCWHNIDPVSLLFTSAVQENLGPEPRLAAHEYEIDDVIQWSYLATRNWPVGVLRHATHGHPETSPRFREILRPRGITEELRASFVSGGACWGAMGIYRDQGHAEFDDDEAGFVAEAGNHLADGIRRALLLDDATSRTWETGPGWILLDRHDELEAMNEAAVALLDDIVHVGPRAPCPLIPHPVFAVAARARASVSGASERSARCRTLTRSGRWLVLHGSQIAGRTDGRIAVIIEPAHHGELAAVIMRAYGLSAREREVTQLVLRGQSTAQIAATLQLSPYTVQDYLKTIFDKVGVHSRRQLIGLIFRDQYEQRAYRGDRLGDDGWFSDANPAHRGTATQRLARTAAARPTPTGTNTR
jgi:DNA-binding CsgD family transcriptional regulator